MPRIRKSQNQPTISRTVWRIAVYIRLSKDDGNDESLSVTNQRKIITEYIEEFFEGEYIIVDVYADDGLTGTDYERPEFQRLIHDVEAGTVNCIICKTLSRAFRNYSDQGYFLEKVFPLYGVRFISIGDPSLDTFKNPDAVQGMEVPITGLMNDRYAARTSNDIRRTFNTKRRKGGITMATKSANVLARVEPEVKEQAESIMSKLGVPASVVINMLYKQIIMTKSIPFSLSLPKEPVTLDSMNTAEFSAMMETGLSQAKADESRTVADVFADLRRELQ